jgi:hypothetical protein
LKIGNLIAQFIFGTLATLFVLAAGSALIVFFYNLGRLAQEVRDALRLPG